MWVTTHSRTKEEPACSTLVEPPTMCVPYWGSGWQGEREELDGSKAGEGREEGKEEWMKEWMEG